MDADMEIEPMQTGYVRHLRVVAVVSGSSEIVLVSAACLK